MNLWTAMISPALIHYHCRLIDIKTFAPETVNGPGIES